MVEFDLSVQNTKDASHGDYCTNFAIKYGKSPEERMQMADQLAKQVNDQNLPFKATVAKPGFVNFQIQPEMLWDYVSMVHDATCILDLVGAPDSKQDFLIEFVSANPTGPISIVNGRAACLGDSLAKIMRSLGQGVQTEFYVNDGPHSTQIRDLVQTVNEYYMAWVFNIPVDESKIAYAGEYLKTITRRILEDYAGELVRYGEEDRLKAIEEFVIEYIIEWQKADLGEIGIHHDKWFFESYLFGHELIEAAFKKFAASGQTFDDEKGAIWLKLPSGDKVIRRADGRFTYLLTDVAYHLNKLERCPGTLINIWGADHHDYKNSLCDALAILGHNRLQVIFTQMVAMKKDGVTVVGSKREGIIEELYADLVSNVGADAARYVFTSVTPSSQMVIDTGKLKAMGKENPVFYIQYAHARLCSIIAKAESLGIKPESQSCELPSELRQAIACSAKLPEVLNRSMAEMTVHNLNEYATNLATSVHNTYEREQIITDKDPKSASLLYAVISLKKVLAWSLDLLGMQAPEKM